MSRADAIKAIRKEAEHAFEYADKVEAITTGSLAIDVITGVGGFPRSRISEVVGWEFSGKSTLCVQACAAAQASGLYPVYIDAEQALDRTLATRIGFDITDQKKGLYLTPRTFEESMMMVEQMVTQGEADLVILDSIPAMTPESQLQGTLTDYGRIGALAAMLSLTLGKLVKMIKHHKVALVLINQFRENIEMNTMRARWAPKEKAAGGSALRFYSSLRIVMKLTSMGSEKRKIVDSLGKAREIPIQNLHSAKTIKNKVAPPYREIDFNIRYDEELGVFGIDNTQTLLDMAVAASIIEQKGSTYSYKSKAHTFTAKSAVSLYLYLHKHRDVAGEIEKAVRERL